MVRALDLEESHHAKVDHKAIAELLIEIKNIVSDNLVVEIQKRGVAIDLAALWILGKGDSPKELGEMLGSSHHVATLRVLATPGFNYRKWQIEYNNKCEAEDLKKEVSGLNQAKQTAKSAHCGMAL